MRVSSVKRIDVLSRDRGLLNSVEFFLHLTFGFEGEACSL
jgi:hypothetical protein